MVRGSKPMTDLSTPNDDFWGVCLESHEAKELKNLVFHLKRNKKPYA
jgi:hypothetical protein